MSFLFDILTICLSGLVILYIVAPIVIYFKQQMPLHPEFYSLTDSEIESLTTPDFVVRSRAMEALGFEQATNLQWILPESRTFVRIFYRPSTQELAHVGEVTTQLEGKTLPPSKVRYVEFSTEFEDAPEINTNNVHLPSALHPVPERRTYALPGVDDVTVLYKVHRSLTEKISDDVKPLPAKALLEERLQFEISRTLRRQVEVGYMYFDESRSIFRPTAKGATLMAWKFSWPVLPIRKWMVRRNAQRLIQAVT